MAKNSRWLAVPVLLVVVVVLVLVWRGCCSDDARPPAVPGEFEVDTITFTSPDLDLELLSVRTTDHPGYTDWACLVECRELGGCQADLRVRVVYRAAGEERTLQMGGRLDVERGETARIGRVQRPPTAVERVDEVIVEVAAPYTPDAPRPTPVQ